MEEEKKDLEPNPEAIENYLSACRKCWLMVSRYRHIVAALEQDFDMISSPGVRTEIEHLLRDMKLHLEKSKHEPVVSVVEALYERSLKSL